MNIATIRPLSLDDMLPTASFVGLQKQLERGTLAGCYLFVGVAGTGKTTAARILAGSLLQLKKSDLNTLVHDGDLPGTQYREINVATTGGVADARILEASIQQCASGFSNLPYVFVLDECHGYSKEAQDALKNIMEKVGRKSKDRDITNVYLIFTTDKPDKLNEAFRRRVIRIEFNPVNKERCGRLIDKMCTKLKEEKVGVEIKTRIFEASGGSPGVALKLLQEFFTSGEVIPSPEETHESASNIFTMMKEISNEILDNGDNTANALSELASALIGLKEATNSWNGARISMSHCMYYTMLNMARQEKLDTTGMFLFGEYISILLAPVLDSGIGQYELMERLIRIIKVRTETLMEDK